MNKNTAYGILSDLIFRGFLTTNIRFCGHEFVFKTINEREYDLLKISVGEANRWDHKFNLYYLVYSLFMVDGDSVLVKRTENTGELIKVFNSIPRLFLNEIVKHVGYLRDQQYEAVSFLEGICYSSKSRSKWKILNDSSPTEDYFTGIPGTSRLGLNVCQEQWIIINRMLDAEEKYNNNFSLALMIASATSPKGAKTVGGKHDSNVKQAKEKRDKLAAEGRQGVEEWTPESWAAPVDTAEGLLAELDRQMQGKKDKHDLFMENHFKKVREAAERRTKEAADRIKEIRENRADKDLLISGEQRALTPEESRNLMRKPGSSIISSSPEEYVSPDDKKKFLQKVGSTIIGGRR